ncbi:MAG: peptide-N-glycosidase F-related protein [Planctomycetota bacterium]
MKFPLLVALAFVAGVGTVRIAASGEPAQVRELPQLDRFLAGAGPRYGAEGVFELLDDGRTPGQSNTAAWPRHAEGARQHTEVLAELRVEEGGDGGAFVLLPTTAYGYQGAAPFRADWTHADLPGAFAVGVDVHNPPTQEPFGPDGNVLGAPEREVSLHFDGRELVKRVVDSEFRGAWTRVRIRVEHVVGGAEVTVLLGEEMVYDRWFVAGFLPYESRLAIGASTTGGATTRFDVRAVEVVPGPAAKRVRPPLEVEVFHHVRTDNTTTAYQATVDLPPLEWSFGRILLTLDLHDAGRMWDEWDRNGEISILDDDGTKLGLVPFITSYRTPCHWVVDVTAFRPWLHGRRTFEIAAGTTFYMNRGYLMSVSLAFHHGTPETVATKVVPLWHGTAHYRSDANAFRDFYTPQKVAIDRSVTKAELVVFTTGHGQVGEFTPAKRTIAFTPDSSAAAPIEKRFEDVLWKTDCYLNPNRPQYGTWKYPRAGWAPGDIVHPWTVDLTPDLVPGATARLVYEPRPYEFPDGQRPSDEQLAQATHVVRAYVILYGKPQGLLEAPTMRVASVTKGGNADRAGVKAGDWIGFYDGQRIDSADALRAAIGSATSDPSRSIPLVLFRGSERIEVTVQPGLLGVQIGGA